VESIFGSGRMVDGFFLNNQMTDFSFRPRDAQGRPIANAVAPGKRPRSSMTPAILLDADRRFVGAAGSAGGNAILAYVGKTLVGAVDWHLSMQDSIALPNLVARGENFNGEVTRFSRRCLPLFASAASSCARARERIPGCMASWSGMAGSKAARTRGARAWFLVAPDR
jgi:gamma-glutamyltranspeptidase/glutathione hydrolase